MRIMGLDYGSKTVGVALSDPLFITAGGYEIIRREREDKLRRTYARLLEIIRENDVGEIVCGLPLNMDDTEGERAKKSREFAEGLTKRCGLPVTLFDERLSTVEAVTVMDEAGVKSVDRGKYVDSIAAAVILRDYLNARAAGKV